MAERGAKKQRRKAPRSSGRSSAREKIWAAVARIPRGRVATYGQIARIAGLAGHARQVGYALAALPDDRELPWHRVVNAEGRVSARKNPFHESVQRGALESEGVCFDANDRIDLARYLWRAG